MAITPEKIRRATAALAMGAKALLARGVQVPAGPTMSLGARAQDQQQQRPQRPQPGSPPDWGIPTDPQAAQEFARLAQAVAAGILTPDDRRRASPAARGRQSLHAVGAAMAKAPTAARAALPRASRPRTTDDVNRAARATWQAYRAQATGGAA